MLSCVHYSRIQHPTSKTLLLPMTIVVWTLPGVESTGALQIQHETWLQQLQPKLNNILTAMPLIAHLFTISTSSSMRLLSPMTIGPASAIIRHLGCKTVRAPVHTNETIVIQVIIPQNLTHSRYYPCGLFEVQKSIYFWKGNLEKQYKTKTEFKYLW